VVCFDDGSRVKIKFSEYKRLQRLLTQVSTRVIWDLLRGGAGIDILVERVPDEFMNWVKETVDGLQDKYEALEERATELLMAARYLPTRKEQAAVIDPKNNGKAASVAFAMLDGKPFRDIIWKAIEPEWERPFKGDVE
jgi:RNA ligase